MIRTYGPGSRDCRFDVVEIPTLQAWPHALLPSHLLLCLDAGAASDAALLELADRLIRGGIGALVCHGHDVARVHEMFTEREAALEAAGRLDREDDASIDLSYHDGSTFADTLFAWAMLRPHPGYEVPAVRTVVLVDQPERARDVHRWLPAFCARG